jgi:cysteine desulfurase
MHPRDVVLTSGGTEANNLALRLARSGLVTSRLEHPSVVRMAEALELGGVRVAWVEPLADGRVDPACVARHIDELARAGAVMVSLQAVNHETGVIQPVAEVAALAHARGALLHCDAVQAVGKIGREHWGGADLVSVASHKLRGPKGIGALATRPGLDLVPLFRGGDQERGLRPGTQDPVAAAGFAVAAERAQDGATRQRQLEANRDELEDALIELGRRLGCEPKRNGTASRVPHVSNLSWPGWRGAELCVALDLEGVAVSSGSACSAGSAVPSAVIRAMVGDERAASAVRISMGETTGRDETHAAVIAFERVLKRSTASR